MDVLVDEEHVTNVVHTFQVTVNVRTIALDVKTNSTSCMWIVDETMSTTTYRVT